MPGHARAIAADPQRRGPAGRDRSLRLGGKAAAKRRTRRRRAHPRRRSAARRPARAAAARGRRPRGRPPGCAAARRSGSRARAGSARRAPAGRPAAAAARSAAARRLDGRQLGVRRHPRRLGRSRELRRAVRGRADRARGGEVLARLQREERVAGQARGDVARIDPRPRQLERTQVRARDRALLADEPRAVAQVPDVGDDDHERDGGQQRRGPASGTAPRASSTPIRSTNSTPA